jgi:hypothetical protein
MTATDSRRPERPRRRDDPARGRKAPPAPPAGNDGDAEVLPPGRRDAEGFWIPDGYGSPADLFTPQQRRAQERQRTMQRRRHGRVPPEDGAAG